MGIRLKLKIYSAIYKYFSQKLISIPVAQAWNKKNRREHEERRGRRRERKGCSNAPIKAFLKRLFSYFKYQQSRKISFSPYCYQVRYIRRKFLILL